MNVLVVATRDKRERFRFISEPLDLLPEVSVDVFHSDCSFIRMCLKFAVFACKNRNYDCVVLMGGNLIGLIWLLLIRVFMRTHVSIWQGGDDSMTKKTRINMEKTQGRYLSALVIWIKLILNNIMLKHVDMLIVNSEFLRNIILERGRNEAEVFAVPQPIVLPEVKAGSRYETNEIRLLTVINLSFYEKLEGVQSIIEYLSLAYEDEMFHEKVVIDVLGGGAHLDELSLFVKRFNLNFENFQVNVRGHVENVENYYSNADVFLYCSTLDSLPNVLLEAMGYGLPLIVNDFEPFLSLLEREVNALFFRKEDPVGFSDCLRRLLKDKHLRHSMGDRNRRKVAEEFNMSSIAERLDMFLKKCSRAGVVR